MVVMLSSVSLLCQKIIMNQVFIYFILFVVSFNMVNYMLRNYGDLYEQSPGYFDRITVG